MKSIQSINRTARLKKLFEICDRYKLGCSSYNNYGHRACHFIKEHDAMHILHTYIDLEEIVPNLYKPDLFMDTDCGFYKENNEYNTEFIFIKLLELMEKKQTIFIIVDLDNYYVVPEQNKQKNGYREEINMPVMHSVVFILHPFDHYMYDLFYINSHGGSTLEETTFETKISSTRKKEYTFDKDINYLFVQAFVDRLRKYVNGHCFHSDFNKAIKINYRKNEKYNYYGCNFQNGDFHGICFVFPLIIWYYFNKYYHQSRIVGKRKTQIILPVSHLLKIKTLDLFVKSCFLDFSDDFGYRLLTQSDIYLDKYIHKKNTHLIKKFLSKYVYFIIQPEISEKVNLNQTL